MWCLNVSKFALWHAQTLNQGLGCLERSFFEIFRESPLGISCTINYARALSPIDEFQKRARSIRHLKAAKTRKSWKSFLISTGHRRGRWLFLYLKAAVCHLVFVPLQTCRRYKNPSIFNRKLKLKFFAGGYKTKRGWKVRNRGMLFSGQSDN